MVRLASALRLHAGGAARLELDLPAPASLGDVLDAVAAAHPAVGRRLRDEAGVLRRHVNVFVGADRVLDVTAAVPEGAEISLLPAVSGGAVSAVNSQ